jgi:hypothetical protein
MEPSSLKRFLENSSFRSSAARAESLAKEYNLVPLVSFYLEDELLKRLIRSLDNILKDLYSKLKYDRNIFVKQATKLLGGKEWEVVEFPYYAVPLSEISKIAFVENNVIPPKVLVKEGTFRLTFLPYESYSLMEDAVRRQGEDDIVVEFRDGAVLKMEKRRNIFIENKSVEALGKGRVVLNLVLPSSLIVFSAVVAMNVHPWENVVELRRQDEDVQLRVLEGSASADEVMEGKTLTPKTKSEIYYDFKSKSVLPQEMIEALAAKFS